MDILQELQIIDNVWINQTLLDLISLMGLNEVMCKNLKSQVIHLLTYLNLVFVKIKINGNKNYSIRKKKKIFQKELLIF